MSVVHIQYHRCSDGADDAGLIPFSAFALDGALRPLDQCDRDSNNRRFMQILWM